VWLPLAIVSAFWIAGAGDELLRSSRWAQYVYLADAFLHGSLHLVRAPNDVRDLAQVGGHLFVVFGPFPALLLMPLVPIFQRSTPDVLVLVLTALAGLFAFQGWLERVQACGDPVRLACAVLTLGLGTAMHYGAPMGNVWLHAQITALALQCFALLFAASGRAWLAGVALGLTVLTRSTVTLAAPLVLWELANAPHGGARVGWRRAMVPIVVPVVAAVAVHAVYNWARFGNPTDAGYSYMLMNGQLQGLVANFGRFNASFLGGNLGGWLFRLPVRTESGLAPDPHGMSLLITTPYLLLALWPRSWTTRERLAAACSAIIAIPALLYYNDGWAQFGQRFALDWIPLGLFVAARGSRFAPRSLVVGLTVWGAAVGAWGLQWFRANHLH